MARRDFLKAKHGAIAMQASFRGQAERTRVRKMQAAATMLQSAVRMRIARKEVRFSGCVSLLSPSGDLAARSVATTPPPLSSPVSVPAGPSRVALSCRFGRTFPAAASSSQGWRHFHPGILQGLQGPVGV
jgi:hypothetical protein